MDVRWYQRGVKAKKMAVDFGWNLLLPDESTPTSLGGR
jgi:hypothetical protein